MSPLGTTTEQFVSSQELESIPATVDFIQLVPDPFLESEPDAFVNGTSGEFLYDYEDGVMHLNWTHTAGTELDFRSESDDTYPSFNDFVYFTQSFDWPYEETPVRAVGNLNWSLQFPLTLSGRYFDFYVWLIDSSGNWLRVNSISSYDGNQFTVRNGDVNEIWGGMIEDEFGVQEDPEDTLTIGVGLAPTHEFNYYDGEETWQIYSGSINVSIYSIELHAVMDVEPDPSTHLSPLFNKTYSSDIQNLLPFYRGNNTDVLDRLFATTNDTYGNIYVTGESSSSYELYMEDHLRVRHQFMIKYDPSLNLKWVVRNLNITAARAITHHDGHLYTTGFFDRGGRNFNLMLTKWDLGGRKIWEREWGGVHDQMGVALGVHEDGSIFVMASDCNFRSEGPYWNSTLLKYNANGNLLWNKSLPLCTFLDDPGEIWIFDTHILHYSREGIICINLEGDVLWQRDSLHATCDENGNIYTAPNDDSSNITKLDFRGNVTWSANYAIEYPIEFYEFQHIIDMIVTTNNELLVLIKGAIVDESYRLLKYSLDGTLRQTWTIGDSDWPRYHYPAVLMKTTTTGLLYCSFMDIWTQAFVIGPYTIPDPEPVTFPTPMLLTVGGGIGVIAIAGIYVYKKKRG